MASREIEKLNPLLREKAEDLTNSIDFPILIYCTGRSAEEQARLWRQSKSYSTILKKKDQLEKFGHHELAQILMEVGPQNGPHVTHAGPGESWHQYWEALDAVPIIGGKPAWDYKKNKDLWETLGQVAMSLGLNWGGSWVKWQDRPHFQLRTTNNPLILKVPNCIMRECDL